MKRREVLTALAGAGALTAAPGGRALNQSPLHNCGCAPQVVTARDKPPGAAAFRDVGSKLRITNVRVFGVTLDERIAQSDRPYVFVKLETNQGVTGWGEATLEGKASAATACVMDLKDLIIGSDPMQVEHLYQTMYIGSFYRGGVPRSVPI
jgi:galactonate dehydratase